MTNAKAFSRFTVLLCAVLLCLSPADAQQTGGNDRGGGNAGGGNSDGGRDGGIKPPPRNRSSTGTTQRTPGTYIVVPQTRRVPRKPPPPRRKPVVVPGDRVVAMTDEVRQGDIHTQLGIGAFAVTPDDRPEFIAVGPLADSEAAAAALVGAGAVILRQRDYPNLERRALILDLSALTLTDARQLLATAAPGTALDFHALYGYAEGPPRLYAAALVGQPESPDCVLPPDIRIGQIDGPVATDHPALRDTGIVSHSVLAGSDPPPGKDHGTAVAALMVGQDDTGALAGFATGAKLFAASAFTRAGASESSDVERIGAALDWLVGSKVRLINMSFAGPVNLALANLLDVTAAQGTILIAAAGNGGRAQTVYPAAAAPVIGVTAVDAALKRYRLANTGADVEFAAPGVDLYVANQTGGEYSSGTSYAAPILSALAARLLAQGVGSADVIRLRLQEQSVDLGDQGRDDAFGWGMVKAPDCK